MRAERLVGRRLLTEYMASRVLQALAAVEDVLFVRPGLSWKNRRTTLIVVGRVGAKEPVSRVIACVCCIVQVIEAFTQYVVDGFWSSDGHWHGFGGGCYFLGYILPRLELEGPVAKVVPAIMTVADRQKSNKLFRTNLYRKLLTPVSE